MIAGVSLEVDEVSTFNEKLVRSFLFLETGRDLKSQGTLPSHH